MTTVEDKHRAITVLMRDDEEVQELLLDGATAILMTVLGLQQLLDGCLAGKGVDIEDEHNQAGIAACLSADLFNRLGAIVAEILGCEGCATYAMESSLKRRIREGHQHPEDATDHIGPTEGSA